MGKETNPILSVYAGIHVLHVTSALMKVDELIRNNAAYVYRAIGGVKSWSNMGGEMR